MLSHKVKVTEKDLSPELLELIQHATSHAQVLAKLGGGLFFPCGLVIPNTRRKLGAYKIHFDLKNRTTELESISYDNNFFHSHCPLDRKRIKASFFPLKPGHAGHYKDLILEQYKDHLLDELQGLTGRSVF